MKAILAVGLLAVVGFAPAGCGAGKKTDSATITNTRTTAVTNGGPVVPARSNITVFERTATVANVKSGIWIRCGGWPAPGVKVPPRGQGFIAKMGAASEELHLTHLRNGSIRVVCKSG